MRSLRLDPILAVLLLLSCTSDPVQQGPGPCVGSECPANALPLGTGFDGPVLVDGTLLCQPDAVFLLATATDPQGSANLQGIPQSLSVYPNDSCQGTPITLQSTFSDSGVETVFGTVVLAGTTPGLYEAICGCDEWAVDADLSDADGHATRGLVAARVVVP